ncbi:MAG: hypothetical protein J6Z50_00725, partial [Fibrobacterales bacterium]|nr:hypothetical protein [Fibrobacterales bacterium]
MLLLRPSGRCRPPFPRGAFSLVAKKASGSPEAFVEIDAIATNAGLYVEFRRHQKRMSDFVAFVM